jgi:hypothetical protein
MRSIDLLYTAALMLRSMWRKYVRSPYLNYAYTVMNVNPKMPKNLLDGQSFGVADVFLEHTLICSRAILLMQLLVRYDDDRLRIGFIGIVEEGM